MERILAEKQNYEVFKHPDGHPIKAWVKGVELDEKAKGQLFNLAKMPFIYKHVAVMPDAHWGMGSTVGSVIATKGAVIPAAVGVDLGCGMVASKTSLKASDLPESLRDLRLAIEKAVPHGRTDGGGPNDRGAWGNVPEGVSLLWIGLKSGYDAIIEKHPKLNRGSHETQLGTLGTGNHFIEVCLDTEQNVWIMLHSGSRGVGNRIGSYFIEKAKMDMRRWFINLPDADLAYIPEGSELFSDYWNAVRWAQQFAADNRRLMLWIVYSAMSEALGRPVYELGEVVNCHHNYIDRENHFGENVFVTRKGAVRARHGDMGIIPGSMGAKSFIVRGKGNEESFQSCSHGAGRMMSRGQARREISLSEHIQAVEGVECRLDTDVIDESPRAYKNIDAVMSAQSDLGEIVHTLKQVLCIKG